MGSFLAKNKRLLKSILFISIVICISIFVWNTDFDIVLKELKNIGFKFIYILGISFLAYFFGTWAWYVCLGKDKAKINLFQLFAVRQVGETIGLYNPTSIVGGDIFKAEMLKNYGISNNIANNSVAISRMTTVLSQILLFLIACIWLLSTKNGQSAISVLGNLFYVIIVILFIAKIGLFYWLSSSKYNLSAHTSISSTHSFWKKLKHKISILLIDMRGFYRQDKASFWYSYLLSAIHWVVGSLEFYLILHFLGFDVQVMHGLLLDMSIIVIKSAGAFIPGQLGIEELGNKLMLDLIGIQTAGVWITVSILRRVRQLSWIGIGFIFYCFIQKQHRYVTN